MRGVLLLALAAACCADVRVDAFFKRAFDTVSTSGDKVHYLAARMRGDHQRLCAEVPACDEALAAVFRERYARIAGAVSRMQRLRRLLERLRAA